MCKIINFPADKVRNTAGYKNLIALFEICENVESCNFYLESVENLYVRGDITENEMHILRRIGRTKRIELANPPRKAQEAKGPGTYCYTPEMGEQKPTCQMEAQRGYYGGHVYIDTPETLKGRGIVFLEILEARRLTASRQYKAGWNHYRVTNRAFENLKKKYTISMECHLD